MYFSLREIAGERDENPATIRGRGAVAGGLGAGGGRAAAIADSAGAAWLSAASVMGISGENRNRGDAVGS